MVRTKATAGVKVGGSKAPRKLPPTTSNTPDQNRNKYSGGNLYCPRETPAWQKPITNFFPSTSKTSTPSTITSAQAAAAEGYQPTKSETSATNQSSPSGSSSHGPL